MQDGRTDTKLRGRARAAVAVAAVTAAALGLAACSSSESSRDTTTTQPRTSSTTAPGRPGTGGQQAGGDGPPTIAWLVQVGGTGADSLAGVAGRNDTVVAVGATEGTTSRAAGGSDALVAVVEAASGELRATTERGSDAADRARGIGSAPTTGLTLACGDTDGELAGPAAGGGDLWCAAVDPAGDLQDPSQSGSDAGDRINGVAVVDEGQFGYGAGVATGLFPGAQDPTGGLVGSGDALVLRLDAAGRPVWARQFGTSGPDEAAAVTVSDDGDAVVTGTTDGSVEGPALGGTDAWVARLDPYGNQRWQAAFGSSGNDRARAVAAGGDPRQGTETFVSAGTTNGDAGGEPVGLTDVLAAAFDASGEQVWIAQFGSGAEDEATGVVVDGPTTYVAGTTGALLEGAERVAVPGATAGEPAGRDGFLAALDTETGTVRWIAQFGSAGDDDVTGLSRTETGLLVASGTTTGQMGTTVPAGGTDGFVVAFPLPSAGGGAASSV